MAWSGTIRPLPIYQATITTEPLPEQRVRFRVPRVAPGRYAVIIYDGAEGGTHYTWSFFRVTRSG